MAAAADDPRPALTGHRPASGRRRTLGGAGAALAAFALVALLVQTGWLYSLDRAVFGWVYSGESPWPLGVTSGRGDGLLQALLPWCDRVADARRLTALIVVGVIFMTSRRWDRGALLLGGSVAAVLLTSTLKHVFERPSPFPLPGDPSFPSGHAALSMAIAAASVAIAAGTRAFWLVLGLASALVLAVALAAVADGGHWPTDIAGGWAIALAWVLALRAVIVGPLRTTVQPG
jgi:membrane-associated phospholipid phosphatase